MIMGKALIMNYFRTTCPKVDLYETIIYLDEYLGNKWPPGFIIRLFYFMFLYKNYVLDHV